VVGTSVPGSASSFATPAIVLGSAAAAGAASTVSRSDGTIAAFDATAPSTQAFGDAAAVGTAAFAARRDHKHAMPAGGLVLLEQHAASTSATLDFTTAITSTYDEYVIEIVNLICATNSVGLLVRMSTDGGSTYDSGANYSYTLFSNTSSGTGTTGANGQTAINLIGWGNVSNASNRSINGSVRLYAPGGALYKQVGGHIFYWDSGNLRVSGMTSGLYEVTTAVNAFRILASSGNLTSGTIRCYGVAK
jgi:hypothetical protein